MKSHTSVAVFVLSILVGATPGAQSQPGRDGPPVLIKKINKNDWITSVLFSPDNRFLLTAHRAPSKTPWRRKLPDGHGEVIVGGRAIVKIWELPRGNLVRTLEVHRGTLSEWAISDSGTLLATGSEAEVNVKLWEIPSGRLVHTLDGVNYPLRFSADGTRLWAGHRSPVTVIGNRVKVKPSDVRTVWYVETGTLIASRDPLTLVSGDGRTGAVDVQDGLEIRNAITGAVVRRLPVRWTNRRALSPDGSRFAVAHGSVDDIRVEVWNTKTGERLWAEVAERPPAEVMPAARSFRQLLGVPELVFSPDGATLVGWNGEQAAVRMWDVETGRPRPVGQSTGGREMQVRDVAFTGDGSLLAVHRSAELKTDTNPAAMPRKNSLGTVTFVRLSTLEPVGELRMRPDATGYTITRDGSHVATRERDGNVRLWRTPPLAR